MLGAQMPVWYMVGMKVSDSAQQLRPVLKSAMVRAVTWAIPSTACHYPPYTAELGGGKGCRKGVVRKIAPAAKLEDDEKAVVAVLVAVR